MLAATEANSLAGASGKEIFLLFAKSALKTRLCQHFSIKMGGVRAEQCKSVDKDAFSVHFSQTAP